MSLPFEALSTHAREAGLVVAVVVGFAFGFVLERSGFGRAQKLVGQFYGNDMTVFKVMFSGIVTAMVGAVVLAGLGVIDLRAVSDAAASSTYLWPMIAGGLLLGAGFIVSGYCPGTSAVATASGKLDGLVTAVGVVVGSIVYAELQPRFAGFHDSGDLGHLYLYDLLGVPPAIVAFGVLLLAVGAFLGAEWVERRLARGAGTVQEAPEPARPRNLAWAGLGAAAAIGLATLLLPLRTGAASAEPERVSVEALASRVLEAPWTLRVIDLRPAEACARARIPGAECVPPDLLKSLALADLPAGRDVVLVGQAELAELPAAARGYPGRTLVLDGGFAAWERFALSPPEPLPQDATAAAREQYRLRSGIFAALTGVPQAPPPPPPTGAPVKRKAGGGGCG